MATRTVLSPFNLLLDGGRKVAFKSGEQDIPDDLVDHWYVKANCAPVESVEGNDDLAEQRGSKGLENPDGSLAEQDDRAALVAEASGLGITVDGRWSIARLKAAIEAAKNPTE